LQKVVTSEEEVEPVVDLTERGLTCPLGWSAVMTTGPFPYGSYWEIVWDPTKCKTINLERLDEVEVVLVHPLDKPIV
jgi:hypothetical protein